MAEYKNLESFAMAVSEGFKIRYGTTKNYDKIARKTAKELAEAISKRSPRRDQNDTGIHYADEWKTKSESTFGKLEMTVYNDRRYMLTHLLENIHPAGIDRHYVYPHRHIGPEVEKYTKLYIERVQKEMEES